jgi:hypothetical protein
MACEVLLQFNDGREFSLGRYNQGKATPEKIALRAAKRYRNLIGKLSCNDARIVVVDGNVATPVNALQQDL